MTTVLVRRAGWRKDRRAPIWRSRFGIVETQLFGNASARLIDGRFVLPRVGFYWPGLEAAMKRLEERHARSVVAKATLKRFHSTLGRRS